MNNYKSILFNTFAFNVICSEGFAKQTPEDQRKIFDYIKSQGSKNSFIRYEGRFNNYLSKLEKKSIKN